MYNNIAECIHEENASTRSLEDQVKLAEWLFSHGFVESDGEAIRRNEIRSRVELEHTTQTVLDNLEGIGLVEKKKPPGGRSFIHHERTNEFLHGAPENEVARLLRPDLKRFLEDIREQDDAAEPTLRDVVSEALGVDPEELDDYLTEPVDPIEKMERYDAAVNAAEESDQVSTEGDYGPMGWRSRANRWTLSEFAERIESNEVLEGDPEEG